MKKLIRRFFNHLGYDIIKTNDWYGSRKKQEKTIRVGNWPVSMPGNNTLLRTYELYPDFNSIIGRLAIVIAKKYPSMTVVDIGANVGDTIAIIKTAIDLPVIGIEGDDISYKFLEKNTRQFSNVNIRKTFLGDVKQEMKVSMEMSGTNTAIIPSKEGAITISLKTLDEVLDEGSLNTTNIKLLKVDVEGFDTIVLRGSSGLIKKSQPVLFFEYNRNIMQTINEDGLSTLLSFGNFGYNRIAFFDYKGRLLLTSSLANKEAITCLHNYAIGTNNLLGFYDICIFHEQDNELAAEFIKVEEKYDAGHL